MVSGGVGQPSGAVGTVAELAGVASIGGHALTQSSGGIDVSLVVAVAEAAGSGVRESRCPSH